LTPIVVTSGGTCSSVTIGANGQGKKDVEDHDAEVAAAAGQLGHDHRGEGHDAGGGEVEPTLLDHQMLADRGYRQNRKIRQCREDRGGVDRARRRDAADKNEERGGEERPRRQRQLGEI